MIDKKLVVGRHLFGESMMTGCFTKYKGKITNIKGSRVYYIDPRDVKDYEGTGVAVPEKFMTTRTVTAVCDTEEEIAKLDALTQRILLERRELENKHRQEFKALFEVKQ